MSSKPYSLLVDDLVKKITGNIVLDWNVDNIATFNANLTEAEHMSGFNDIIVKRGGVEIFGGRIEKPTSTFGVIGRPMPISGFDWTAILKDYPTTSQSIVDSDTETTLDAILSEIGDITVNPSLTGPFEYITALQDWDTSLEFLTTIPTLTNICIEYDPTDLEIDDEFRTGTIADFGIAGGFNCFYFNGTLYGGTTEWFYVFTREGNDIYYYLSPDGETWTRTDSGVNCTTSDWAVGYNNQKVYLLVWDGADTDSYRGTINVGTGLIGFVLIGNNILGGNKIKAGPIFDDSDHIFVVSDPATGAIHESIDDGLTFPQIAVGAANHNIWGVLPTGSDGDAYSFVVDTANNDMEEWFYDRSAGTHTFLRKIANTNGDIDSWSGAINANYRPWISWLDSTNLYEYVLIGGAWTGETVTTNGSYHKIVCDGAECAYLFTNDAAGSTLRKYRDGVEENETSYISEDWGTSGLEVGASRAYTSEGNPGVFFCALDAGDDGWFILTDPTGLRINNGSASGSFETDIVTASGSFQSWGMLTAEGVGIGNGADVLWDILKSADSSELASDEVAPFDLDLAGVPTTETSIIVNGELTDNGTDPYVYEFDITEKTDNVSLDTDYEDVYTAVKKLANLAGAEFYVEKEDDGTYTLYFTVRRGEDKSDWITLKCASSTDEPSIVANIKVFSKLDDWSDYANVVMVVGGTDSDGNRIIGECRDNDEISDKEKEYWYILRDGDVETSGMARQRAYVELTKRNSPRERISAEFIDKQSSTELEIGDSVTLLGMWKDPALNINGSYRIVHLKRIGGTSGEQVTADFSNRLKEASYWNYQRRPHDNSRWILT